LEEGGDGGRRGRDRGRGERDRDNRGRRPRRDRKPEYSPMSDELEEARLESALDQDEMAPALDTGCSGEPGAGFPGEHAPGEPPPAAEPPSPEAGGAAPRRAGARTGWSAERRGAEGGTRGE